MCVCVCAWVRACVRACMHACVCVCCFSVNNNIVKINRKDNFVNVSLDNYFDT